MTTYSSPSLDETFVEADRPRPACRAFVDRLRGLSRDELRARQRSAEVSLQDLGITFNVYGRDYADVCPIQGVFIGGGQHAMNVAIDVLPVE